MGVINNLNNNENNSNTNSSEFKYDNRAELEYLKSIDATLRELLRSSTTTSQSNARNSMHSRDDFRNPSGRRSGRVFQDSKKSFTDGLEDVLIESVLGSDYKDKIKGALNDFADLVGVNLEDVPNALGRELGTQAISAVKKTKFGSDLFNKIDSAKSNIIGDLTGRFKSGVSSYNAKHGTNFEFGSKVGAQAAKKAATDTAAKTAAETATSVATGAGVKAAASSASTVAAGAEITALSTGASGAGAALAGLGSMIPPVLVALAALAVATILLDKLFDQFAPAIEGAKKMFEQMKNSANRYQNSRKKNLELAQKRLEEDTETIIKAPFKILEDAAQKAYDVWDAQLRKINGTQGYNKSDLQNLMSAYANRLRSEGLSSVIGSTDVTENLAKVLDSGLSGKVAEEFAYLATKLNAAIPTQDFFGYADEYAEVAANAIRQGKSESEAIAYASEQLETFASDVLYASRQIAGGFSTGLKDAESLFDEAVKIAQASKTGNASQIAGVLTSVSAITGAIAPDLASSMTEAIVKAATGGNSSEIVALRSLAGINASNTEFLRQVANNPQKVFATLFRNLAKMQNMSNDAYMEVAEGLSSVFGVSMDAFARIDFNYLADAITNMSVNNAALDENMKLLISGQTTTSAEQLRLQQINKYMIDEGLAYVLDNEVARSIQEHMWDEQMARELMEATYAVELKGSALEFLEGIRTTVENIINFLNPFAWIKKLGNLAATAVENKAQEADLRQILELGKVGNGNVTALRQLTTRNADLNVAPSIVNMMGGVSLYDAASNGTKLWNTFTNPLGTNTSFMNNLTGSIKAVIQKALTTSTAGFGINSSYSWGSLGKSTYAAISGGSVSRGSSVGAVVSTAASSASSVSASVKKLQEMLDEDYINKFVEEGKSYDDWAASARSKGISDLNSAIEDAGYTEEAVKGWFQKAQSNYGAKQNAERIKVEDEFWEKGKVFWDTTLKYEENITSLVEMNNSWLEKIFKKSDQFYTSWVDYFVNHTAYNNAYRYSDVEKIKAASKAKESGDLVNALAEALVQNTVDLKDPQVQTNALLSQILIVIQAIMNQNNKVGGLSLPDSLNALALGLVKQT